ncbi:MAG TPA: polysaccharide deacetylase family protein [Kofleriaceae bacterium]|jgi:peptidoglycan/xylan/chitin deacetylase (PgdA/CDA1 family)
MLAILVGVLVLGALGGLTYLFWYGGYGGPIDWAMHTTRYAPRNDKKPVVALTFDDGPDPIRTPALLDALRDLDVKATFFVVGREVERHPEIVERMAAEGHEIGNHTFHHVYLPLHRHRTVEHELRATDRAVEDATGVTPTLARPPWGARRPSTVRAFARLAKKVVLWDVNSFDWKGKPPVEVVERVMDRAKPGSIILLHEAREEGETTIDIVRRLVPVLRARGFQLATVSQAVA